MKVNITNLTGGFKYSLSQDKSNNLKFQLDVVFENRFSEGPIFALDLILSEHLRLIDEFYFSQTSFRVRLSAYYFLSEEDKTKIKITADASHQGAKTAQAALVFQKALTVGSTIAMKSLMLMEFIRFMRYIDIK